MTIHVNEMRGIALNAQKKIGRFNQSAADPKNKPDHIMEYLNLKPGMKILEIGVGGAYYLQRFATAIGPEGIIYAMDTNPEFLENAINSANNTTAKIVPVHFKTYEDLKKIDQAVDLVFTRNTYHHLENRTEYFKQIGKYLKSTARVVIIDYNQKKFSIMRFRGHFTRKETILKELADAGYGLADDPGLLKTQNLLVFNRACNI